MVVYTAGHTQAKIDISQRLQFLIYTKTKTYLSALLTKRKPNTGSSLFINR